MKDHIILRNARDMLLITASSFCLSAAANALPQASRVGQEYNLRQTTSDRCASKADAMEDERRKHPTRLLVATPQV